MKPNILSLLVTNRFGVLTKVTMLFGRRGCNIHSLTVDTTHMPELSRITVTVYESDEKVVQIFKQLKKLEDVQEVILYRDSGFVEREIVLIKLNEGLRLEDFDFDGMNIYINKLPQSNGACIVEAMGASEDISDLINKIGQENIFKLSRSGCVALGLSQ